MQDREGHPGLQYRLALEMTRNEGSVVSSLVNWKDGTDNGKREPRPDFSFGHTEFGVIDARWKLGKQTYCGGGEGRVEDTDTRVITTEGLVEHWSGGGMIERRVRVSGERAREETDLPRIES